MQLTIFGATGGVGGECLRQSVEAGHDVTVLVRTPSKLPDALRDRIRVIEGDALDADDVDRALEHGPEAILFAIGVDAGSPEDLCTDATRLILDAMRRLEIRRLVWCGGGSTRVDADPLTFGTRFVELFARVFMGLRHRDKAHQLELLNHSRDVQWVGVRPLQIREGPRRGDYRLGFDRFSGLSWISFADCADAMLKLIDDDTWLHRAPILQY